jgi:hypothetical protein
MKSKANVKDVQQVLDRKADISFCNKLFVENVNTSLAMKADKKWVEESLNEKATCKAIHNLGNMLQDKISLSTLKEHLDSKVDRHAFDKFSNEMNSMIVSSPDVSYSYMITSYTSLDLSFDHPTFNVSHAHSQ